MDTSIYLLLGAVFICATSLVGLAIILLRSSQVPEKRRVKKRLLYLSRKSSDTSDESKKSLKLLKQAAMEDAGVAGRLLLRIPRLPWLDNLLIRGGSPFGPMGFISLSLLLALGVFAGVIYFCPYAYFALMASAGMALIPYMRLKIAAANSLKKIENQLPEALDMMTRALRAGHALSTAMEIVTTDLEDPVRAEFAEVVEEVRYGISLHDSLANLCNRVPLEDFKFFATTVSIHKETGGNLTEVLEKIATLIRQRQQFRQHVEALTAEGRFSALILLFLPTMIFIYLYFSNREYVEVFWMEPVGQYMAIGAILMQLFGYLVMRRMLKLEV